LGQAGAAVALPSDSSIGFAKTDLGDQPARDADADTGIGRLKFGNPMRAYREILEKMVNANFRSACGLRSAP
jgi:hypothetical protein